METTDAALTPQPSSSSALSSSSRADVSLIDIMEQLQHMHVTIPPSPLFYVMGAISKESIWKSVVDLAVKQPHMETMDAAPTLQPSSSSIPSSSSRADVSFVDIMNQL